MNGHGNHGWCYYLHCYECSNGTGLLRKRDSRSQNTKAHAAQWQAAFAFVCAHTQRHAITISRPPPVQAPVAKGAARRLACRLAAACAMVGLAARKPVVRQLPSACLGGAMGQAPLASCRRELL